MMESELVSYVIQWGYMGIFIWFVTIDQFTPIPHEISLLTIGYLSANEIFNPLLAATVAVFSFLVVDVIYYRISMAGHKTLGKISENDSMLSKYATKMEDHMGKTILILCFIPRIRFISPILVGILKLSFRKFLIYDILSLGLFSLIYVILGNLFHRSLSRYIEGIDQATYLVFLAALFLFALIFFMILLKNTKGKKV